MILFDKNNRFFFGVENTRSFLTTSDGIIGPIVDLRVATSDQDTVLFAGHSFLQTAWGGETSGGTHGGVFEPNWPGNSISDFVPFGSATQVWDLDGNARNSSYDQIIVTEIADLGTGFPPPGPGLNETLQKFYWFGLEAQKRNAELILYTPWSPAGTDLDESGNEAFAYIRFWLEKHLEVPVWIIPAGAYVKQIRDEFGNIIYSDGLHLDANTPYPRGLSYMTYSFLTKQRCPFVIAGDEYFDQLAWDILQNREEAGFGGSQIIIPEVIEDPLPNPLPLEEEWQITGLEGQINIENMPEVSVFNNITPGTGEIIIEG